MKISKGHKLHILGSANNALKPRRTYDFEMSLFMFLCDEVAPVIRTQALNTNLSPQTLPITAMYSLVFY